MTKHTVDEAIGGFEPKTDNSVIELGLGGESCAATALRDMSALKEAQHMLNCGIYGDGSADPLSPAFRINIAKLLDKACAPNPAYTAQADIEAMARGIAAYIYQTQGLETMCYSGVDNYVERESHCYHDEANAALSASRLPDELARLQRENERLQKQCETNYHLGVLWAIVNMQANGQYNLAAEVAATVRIEGLIEAARYSESTQDWEALDALCEHLHQGDVNLIVEALQEKGGM